MDPSRKSVEEVVGAKFSRSAMPNPADHAGSPSRTTATAIPGTLFADMKLETAVSISPRFSVERLFCCEETAEAQARSKASRQTICVRKRFVSASRALAFTGHLQRESIPNQGGSEQHRGRSLLVLRASTPVCRNALTLW